MVSEFLFAYPKLIFKNREFFWNYVPSDPNKTYESYGCVTLVLSIQKMFPWLAYLELLSIF